MDHIALWANGQQYKYKFTYKLNTNRIKHMH